MNTNDNNNDSDNTDNTDKPRHIFSETVVTNPEQLKRLPQNIYDLVLDYEKGHLPSIAKADLDRLLELWFSKKKEIDIEEDGTIYEQRTETTSSDVGFEECQSTKRSRINSTVSSE